MSETESTEISRVGIPLHAHLHVYRNCEVFVKFEEQLNKSEIFYDEFYFKIF